MSSDTMPAPIPIAETSAQGRRRSSGNSGSGRAPAHIRSNNTAAEQSLGAGSALSDSSLPAKPTVGSGSGSGNATGGISSMLSSGGGASSANRMHSAIPASHNTSSHHMMGSSIGGAAAGGHSLTNGGFSFGQTGAFPMSMGHSYGKDLYGTSFKFLAGTSSGSYRGAMPMSFGKDVKDMMEYSLAHFSTSIGSVGSEGGAAVAPSSLSSKLESTFCRNFSCCDQELDDLHDLLQHYEECHVKFDDMEELSSPTPPTLVHDDGSSGDSSSPSSPENAPGMHNGKGVAQATAIGGAAAAAAQQAAARKRSFGLISSTPQNSSAVQQPMRRNMADLPNPLAGRAIARAGSPFSTPGGSIPGTPTGEADFDSLLGGHGGGPAFGALSLRNNYEDHNLPSCAPPTLFFPANSTAQTVSNPTGAVTPGAPSTTAQPPSAKRERLNSANGSIAGDAYNKDFDPKSFIMLPGNVEKPYKCPAPGCDKAYKQMNGLKYHRLHGHCNQNNAPIFPAGPAQLAALAHSQSQMQQYDSAASSAENSAANSPVLLNASPQIASANAFNASAAQRPLLASGATTPGLGTPNGSTPNSPFSANAQALPASPNPGSAHAAFAAGTGLNSPGIAGIGEGFFGGPGPQRSGSQNGNSSKVLYLCQVGTCGKTYKNLNGLRYHYLHSGSHGLLGLQVLHAYGGGNSAKMGEDGKALVSTDTLKPEEVARAARLAAEMQAKKSSVTQKTVDMVQAQALAGGGPGHNHKQVQQLEEALAQDGAP